MPKKASPPKNLTSPLPRLSYEQENFLFDIANFLEENQCDWFFVEYENEQTVFYALKSAADIPDAGHRKVNLQRRWGSLQELRLYSYLDMQDSTNSGAGTLTPQAKSFCDQLAQVNILEPLAKIRRNKPDTYTKVSSVTPDEAHLSIPSFNRNVQSLLSANCVKLRGSRANASSYTNIYITEKGLKKIRDDARMLISHFKGVEQLLLENFDIASGSGHDTLKGSAREAFVKDFLSNHLSNLVGIGSGEVIDVASRFKEPRHQIDVIIYGLSFPRIYLGGGATCFLSESVYSIIEVKSKLDEGELEKAMLSTRDIRRLQRRTIASFGKYPPYIRSYVVAYDGPKNMNTVCNWIGKFASSANVAPEEKNPLIDGVFILGKGFVMDVLNDPPFVWTPGIIAQEQGDRWAYANTDDGGSLLILFAALTNTIGSLVADIDFNAYISSLNLDIRYAR